MSSNTKRDGARILVDRALIVSIQTMQSDQKEITKQISQISKDQAVATERALNHFDRIDKAFVDIEGRLDKTPDNLIHRVNIMWNVGKAMLYLVAVSLFGGASWLISEVVKHG